MTTPTLDWKQGFDIPIDDPEPGDNDWHRVVADLCKLMGVESDDRIWCVDSDSADYPSINQDNIYDLVFQDVFGQNAERWNPSKWELPEGCTQTEAELYVYTIGGNEEDDDGFDNNGYLISKDGKPVLFISYPYGAGVYFYWVKP